MTAQDTSSRPEGREERRARRARSRRAAEDARASLATDDTATAATSRRPSGAALVAVVLLLWAQSLLVFDWARRKLFEPEGSGHLVLVVPIFAGAIVAAGVALVARWRGKPTVGGPTAHRFGVASGLLGITAVLLALVLGPGLARNEDDSRRLRAVHQLEDVAAALDRHAKLRGTYPVGEGLDTLATALTPDLIAASFSFRDPWGHPLAYVSVGDGTGYLLLSRGRDGVEDLPLGDYAERAPHAIPKNDLVVLSGRFLSPELDGLPDVPSVDPRRLIESRGETSVPSAAAP